MSDYQLTFEDDLPESRSRADQILAAFTAFHRANPLVWSLFKKFTFAIIDAGYSNYSVNAIFERIRWHINIDIRTDEPVKLNNNYRAYYSRLFAVGFPEHDGFFRTRRRISAEQPAQKVDIAVFNAGMAVNEAELMVKLRALV